MVMSFIWSYIYIIGHTVEVSKLPLYILTYRALAGSINDSKLPGWSTNFILSDFSCQEVFWLFPSVKVVLIDTRLMMYKWIVSNLYQEKYIGN